MKRGPSNTANSTSKRSRADSTPPPEKPIRLDEPAIKLIISNANDDDQRVINDLETNMEGWKVAPERALETIANQIENLPPELRVEFTSYLFSDASAIDRVEQYRLGIYLKISKGIEARKMRDDASAKANHDQLLALTGAKTVVAFVNVGQGDFTLVRTKAGRIILIDCGHQPSQRNDCKPQIVNLKSVLNSNFFTAGSSKQIDIAILSHPDQDHYLLLADVLDTFKISRVYYSANLTDYDVDGVTHAWLTKNSTSQIKISLNSDGYKKNGVPMPTTGTSGDEKIDNKAILIHSEDDCKIYILASDVPAINGDDNTNAGSVVVLLELGGYKILVCADATYSTENFLTQTFGNADTSALSIKDLHLIRITHHGSDNKCSAQSFVDIVKPKHAIVSAAFYGVQNHGLPKLEALARYWKSTRLMKYADQLQKRTTHYWYNGENYNNASDDNDKNYLRKVGLDGDTRLRSLYSTGSVGTIIWTPEKPDLLANFVPPSTGTSS